MVGLGTASKLRHVCAVQRFWDAERIRFPTIRLKLNEAQFESPPPLPVAESVLVGVEPAPSFEGLYSSSTFIASCPMAAVIPTVIEGLKKTKAISRAAQAYSKGRKGRFASVVRTVGNIADSLGFAQPMTNGSQSASRKKNRRRKNRTKRRGMSLSAGNSGNTAGAANAPTAFARTKDLKPYFQAYPSEEGDGCIVHTVDYVGQTGSFSATAGAWQQNSTIGVTPASASFPWTSAFAALFAKYKLKMLRVWYEHYAPTSVQGQIVLQFIADASYNNVTALTQAESQNMSNYVAGACYEDFCLEADLTAIDKSQWYNTENTLATNATQDDHQCGRIYVFSSNANASQASTGNFWVEAVWEFNSRKTNDITVGLNKVRTVMGSPHLSKSQKMACLIKIFNALMEKEGKKEREIDLRELDEGLKIYEALQEPEKEDPKITTSQVPTKWLK